MFTGIVESAVPTVRWTPSGGGGRLCLPAPDPSFDVDRGDSVAVSGCCLTVVGHEDDDGNPSEPRAGARMWFDLSAETLARTWFGELAGGRRVNVERALRLGDRLGGHLVSGHVDGLATVVELADPGDGGRVITFEIAPGLERYLIEKGSVTLDGVSLTVVEPEGRRFQVALIPETLAVTTLADLAPGNRVHVEADQVGKWIERLFPGR